MTEAKPCPQCPHGRLIYPVDISEQRCMVCRIKANRIAPRTVEPGRWPYRSEAKTYDEGLYDDDPYEGNVINLEDERQLRRFCRMMSGEE